LANIALPQNEVMLFQSFFNLDRLKQILASATIGIAVCIRVAGIGQAAAPCPGQGPSFDCAKAHSAVEMAICRSPILACLDAQLATAYKSALARFSFSIVPDEKAKQYAWLAKRDACRSDQLCLEEIYRQRLAEIAAIAEPLSNSSAISSRKPGNDISSGLNTADRRRLTEERQHYLDNCRNNASFAVMRDCGCLADAFMAERIKQGWSVGEQAIKEAIQGLCVNRSSTRKYEYNRLHEYL
jgi:uncharacterized protein